MRRLKPRSYRHPEDVQVGGADLTAILSEDIYVERYPSSQIFSPANRQAIADPGVEAPIIEHLIPNEHGKDRVGQLHLPFKPEPIAIPR